MLKKKLSFLLAVFALWPLCSYAADAAHGASCTGHPEGANACNLNGCFRCTSGTWTDQPFYIGNSTDTCDSSHAGLLRWTGAELDVCTGSTWSKLAPSCLSAIGTECADGTVFAGYSPDTNVPMYTTHCDAGQTWGGSSCSGTRSTPSWNNGTSPTIVTGYTSWLTGRANTTGLAALSNAESPYNAATYCKNLSANGHSDWYLPGMTEMTYLFYAKSEIGGFSTGGAFYWSSTENNDAQARVLRLSDGASSYSYSKNQVSSILVRCIRR